MKYIIHPVLEVNIITTDKRYASYFRNEYQRVSGFEPIKSHTIVNVYIVNKLPAKQIDDRLKKIKFKKMFTHQYLIRGLDSNQVDIYFKDSLGGKLYEKILTLILQSQVLEPIIYLKLLEHNVLFMHAAGVTDGTHGYLFPAHGGTGKTTLTLGLMGEGLQVLGDDLVLVELNTKLVYPYLRPLHIFTYNANSLRDAIMPLNIRMKLKIKDMIRNILEIVTNQEFLISTRVHADLLYTTFRAGKAVPYRKIFFLKKTGEHERIKVTPNNIQELAKKIMASEDLNGCLYENVLKHTEINDVVDLEIKIISQILNQVEYLELINTRLLDFKNLSKFKQRILAE